MVDMWFCTYIIMYTKISNNVKDFLPDRKRRGDLFDSGIHDTHSHRVIQDTSQYVRF